MWIGELSLKQIEDGHPIRPTTTIDEKGAQVLMDELWACGIRPTEGAGTAGSMEATRRHLEDMRLIALGTLRGIGAIGKEEK
jgi:hypothetical protein